MKKLKEKLKRGLAMMMAAAAIVSSLPSMSVLAASETAKITFQHCHDAAGNTIRYQQTVTHDGRTCSEAGEIRSRIYADGEPAFCMQNGQKTVIKSAEKDNLQAQINLAQHIEAIAGSVSGHMDVRMKNIRTTRKREQDKCHQDYMKEEKNHG